MAKDAYAYTQQEGRIPDEVGSGEYENPADGSAAIIGGADGPTEILVTSQPAIADTQEP